MGSLVDKVLSERNYSIAWINGTYDYGRKRRDLEHMTKRINPNVNINVVANEHVLVWNFYGYSRGSVDFHFDKKSHGWTITIYRGTSPPTRSRNSMIFKE